MKIIRTYLNDKGQGLIEFTLILAFCAVLITGLRSDEFNRTIRLVFENGVFDDVDTSITAGAYAQAGKSWSQSSRRTLNNIQYSYGRYYLGEDIVANQKRIDADKAALSNLADFFLGMSIDTLKVVFSGDTNTPENLFNNTYFPEGKQGKEILLLNFHDEVFGVEDKYDPNTQQYDGVSAITTLDPKSKTGRKFNSEDVIHWLQGDYGRTVASDPNSFTKNNYNEDYNFDSNKRYFYSNEMIDPDGTYSGGTIKRNIRVNFTVNNGVVTSIVVRAQRNGQDIPELTITKNYQKN